MGQVHCLWRNVRDCLVTSDDLIMNSCGVQGNDLYAPVPVHVYVTSFEPLAGVNVLMIVLF